jgi:hypothetical protein
MVTSTLHVLFMTPCLFVITEDVKRWLARRQRRGTSLDVSDQQIARAETDTP